MVRLVDDHDQFFSIVDISFISFILYDFIIKDILSQISMVSNPIEISVMESFPEFLKRFLCPIFGCEIFSGEIYTFSQLPSF
jgi:hypothetical protein